MAAGVARFRWKLQLAILIAVATVTGAVLVDAQRRAEADAALAMRGEFQDSVTVLRHLHALRSAALLERCRELVRKPRLHAALEDDALDLLYPSARDEMRDVMEGEENDAGVEQAGYGLHAEFYRFLDARGALIPPGSAEGVGYLTPGESAQLALPRVPQTPQIGALVRTQADVDGPVFDIVAMPVRSSETGEVIAALVLGFEPASRLSLGQESGIRRGLWIHGELYGLAVPANVRREILERIASGETHGQAATEPLHTPIDGVAHWMFYEQLNRASAYPPVFEVCLYSLRPLEQRLRDLRWRVLGTGGLALLLGISASQLLAGRLARPVERLAQTSEEQLARRRRAEAALEQTSEELQRAARFSADASHQLKTPVAVLRAGLEELQAGAFSGEAARAEIAGLIRQTHRLSGVIDDLLLLSRLDAGRLNLELHPIDLVPLLESALDDLSVRPERFELTIETDFPATLPVIAERRFAALILQNLLENAGKYNRPGGRVRLAAAARNGFTTVIVGNTGNAIPPAAQPHIFERFHRGIVGENVPGYGLGLNLARELARLHGGDLRLLRSQDDWTEFEVSFRTGAFPRP